MKIDLNYDTTGYWTEGTHVITITGVSGSTSKTITFNLVVDCSVSPTEIVWNIPQDATFDEIIKVYLFGWSFTSFVIDPIVPPTIPFSGSTSCTNLIFESWSRTSEILNSAGSVDSTSTVALASNLSDSAVNLIE